MNWNDRPWREQYIRTGPLTRLGQYIHNTVPIRTDNETSVAQHDLCWRNSSKDLPVLFFTMQKNTFRRVFGTFWKVFQPAVYGMSAWKGRAVSQRKKKHGEIRESCRRRKL